MESTQMECCPYCYSDEGFYTKGFAKGKIVTRYNFDGSQADNGDIYESLSHTESKYVYCLSCNKRLFKSDKIPTEQNAT